LRRKSGASFLCLALGLSLTGAPVGLAGSLHAWKYQPQRKWQAPDHIQNFFAFR
jgi:hypothetical protein